ncbi:MAG: hypothetical protein AAFO79_08115, partial [Pseudomonadota bacterium]
MSDAKGLRRSVFLQPDQRSGGADLKWIAPVNGTAAAQRTSARQRSLVQQGRAAPVEPLALRSIGFTDHWTHACDLHLRFYGIYRTARDPVLLEVA